MYSIYKQIHPPTGIEHCTYCHFFSSTEKNLVIAGVNQLHVYKLNYDAEVPGGKTPEKPEPRVNRQKLECLASFSLFGNITSMQNVRLVGSTRDALLLSFKDAKLSLVEYDPGTHDLKTTSMHYFEDEDLKGGLLSHSHHIPVVRVDTDNRCAAMLIYGTRLVILPFRREGLTEESDNLMFSKSPIMSSYIINTGHDLDEKITNIVDFQFLHGYYEPTLFILYEPLPTWPGRIAVRKDSCSIAAISLNIQERVHPVIWSLSSLPHDCSQAYAVPKPIGGVLVMAANSLIYLNQSVPPYGVSLNSITEVSTDFLLRTQEDVKMSLDCAQASFIDGDKMVISLKGGELYVLTMVVDGMRHVRSFHFDKAAASVLTTCMCTCEESFLFLGSRLGNSLLLKYTEKAIGDQATQAAEAKSEEPAAKKLKQDPGDLMASDVSQLDDMDELEVYGTAAEQQMGSQITAYMFEVCDSILNIGPCSTTVMGEPAFLSEEFSNAVSDFDLELVSASGYGKNGALSVIQRTIRPQVVTTFELPGCTDMWTVYGKKSEEGSKEDKGAETGHSFLILSREDSTMILQTGQEIMELDHSGFSTQEPTIFAGNLGKNKYIVQVSQMAVRLLEGIEQLQLIPLEFGSPIAQCSIADPYVLLLTEEGQIILLSLKMDSFGTGVRLAVTKPTVQITPTVLTVCAYRDVSGIFTTKVVGESKSSDEASKTSPMAASVIPARKSMVDDEDELLYGESDFSAFKAAVQADRDKTRSSGSQTAVKEATPTYWAVMARDNGVLEIYSLPDFKLHFLVKNFPVGQKVLVDSGQVQESSSSKMGFGDKSEGLPVIKELLMVGLGSRQTRPFLMARANDNLLMYEAFPYHTGGANDKHLKLRFKKIPHGLIVKSKKQRGKKKMDEGDQSQLNNTIKWLRPFTDISGYAGVFLSGPYPHWIFMTYRGVLRMHPMGIDGAVTCFASFNNVNCPKGFLYFNRQGELRISVLPTHLTYDAPWPVRKVPLRCTPHFVMYHPESKTYSVVTSIPELCSRICRVVGEGEKVFEDQTRDDRFIYPTINRYSVQLFSPISWEAIPSTKIELAEFEHITSAKCVYLKSEGTVSGKQGFIAMATNISVNEEVTARGRIYILDVIEVVPEPGQPLTKNKLKVVYDKEQKGPVTALDAVNGFLVSAIGQKIYIWTLKDDDLSGVAFIDTQIYICSLAVIKNMIMVGDLLKSVSLLRYQPEMKVLSLVSRDIKPLEVYATEFMVDNSQLNFLVSDREKNLVVFCYQPEVRESYGGQRLIRKADINIGVHVNTFFRIMCKRMDPSTGKPAVGAIERRHVTYYASLDGSLGFILPISEKVYRRLLMLQNALNTHIQHLGGLNPKAYRLLQSSNRCLSNPQKSVLDGDLLWKYLNLTTVEMVELAKRIGTSQDQLIDDLMDIDRTTAHF